MSDPFDKARPERFTPPPLPGNEPAQMSTASHTPRLDKYQRRPRMGDRRLAVSFLGCTAAIAVVGDVILLMNDKNPPGGLLAVAGGCIGALATLVTAAPSKSERPTHE